MQKNNDVIVNPGDVEITLVSLTSYNGAVIDVTALFEQINIYEDLFSNCITGSITICESFGLLRQLPIIGEETINIQFRTPSRKKLNLTFATFKVPQILSPINSKLPMYRIDFMSQEGITDLKRKVSKAYTGKVSDIVTQIFMNYFQSKKPLTAEPTCYDYSTVIPNWNPFSAINWLSSKSFYAKNPNSCGYLFYETLDGFNFKPIEVLINTPIMQTYYNDSMANVRNDPSQGRDINREFCNALKFEFVEIADNLKSLKTGMFSGHLVTHDLTNKQIAYTPFNYHNFFTQTKHLAQYPLLPNSNDNFSNEYATTVKLFSNTSNLYDTIANNEHVNERVLKRNSLLEQIQAIKLKLTVPGDSDRRVGEIVFMNIPLPEKVDSSGKSKDPRYTGKYLITAIHHVIKPHTYHLDIELSSDSINTPFEDKKSDINFSE